MNISIVGIGMGNPDTLTLKADRLLKKADLIIGASRIMDSLGESYLGKKFSEIYPDKIKDIIEGADVENIVIAMSGDTGFYSGCKKLLLVLCDYDCQVVAGISSMQYLSSQIAMPWQDFKLVSAHGIDCNVLGEVLSNKKVFFLTGGNIRVHDIVDILCNHGMGKVRLIVGQRLSYEDEEICDDLAENLRNRRFENLSVVLVLRDNEDYVYCGNIPDDAFIRGKVPMTKRDVRGAIVARLNINDGDVIYDIGAGTGSCCIEMAMLNRKAKIYAVEINEEAYDLINKNIAEFHAYNIETILGKAPLAIDDLPAPSAAFIGGSKGNIESIVETLLDKNPHVRLVISAVTYETLTEAINVMKKYRFENLDISQIAVTNTRQVGAYNMLMAQNPVFIISGEGVANAERIMFL